ncbi:hypothetical protein L208DRAFT_1058531, partial [Tricholoma matsutake]
PPQWMQSVFFHLTSCNLGPDWRTCVDTWVHLEEKLEYSVWGKGALPSPKLQPSEWTKWTAKAHNGQHCYTSVPTITKPAEFGHAVAAWWNDMQPAFHKGNGPLPQEIYNDSAGSGDVWAPLWKGGPNSFVSILTLLVWWGQCCVAQTRWR